MGFFRRVSRYILGIDDTETSDQERFIKDLYLHQKNIIKDIDKHNVNVFVDTLLKKHDLLEFALLLNRNIVLSSEEVNKKEILKYFDFFENVKNSLKERVILLKDNPWIGLFEKERFVFVTKKEIKLSEIEINAITHDVLNNKNLFLDNQEIVNETNNLDKIMLKKQSS